MESTVVLQQALDIVEALPDEEQDLLVELLQRRRVERRRREIAANAEATLREWQEGKAKSGSLEDLKRDLLEEP